ncbi:MAG: DotU family type IV/VI secretion system protein [Chloroflexi bacterium]|nr:DotU family type IV/VI secretion system protein [Chloroflexota bacterium]
MVISCVLALVLTLDEVLFNTPWGRSSVWFRHP